MRGSSPIWRLLTQAQRENLSEVGEEPIQVSGGLTRRRLLGALGAAAAIPLLGWSEPLRAQGKPKVVIIGAGMAGLVALDRLTAAGVETKLYEARGRLGGRVITANGAPEPGLDIEDGGNLINTDHPDMLALAERFKIPLIDRKPMTAHNRYVVDGVVVSENQLIKALRPIAAIIGKDAAALDKNFEKVAPRLDKLSAKTYLDRMGRKLTPTVRALLEATVRTEFGVEPEEASALELIFNLPVVDGAHAELISSSDERFILTGGSSSVVRALSKPLMKHITTGHALTAIEKADRGVKLRFANGKTEYADRVIVTVPAPLMRTIDYGGLLPKEWQALVAEFDSGRNDKINAGYANRLWDGITGPAGAAWMVDTKGPGVVSEFWDASSGQPGIPGVLTWFFGGKQADALAAGDPELILRQCEAAVAPAIPSLKARSWRRTAWSKDPFSRGAYSNYRPGQLTRFASHFWVEEDGEVTAPASAGPIIFAGEHLSDAFPGFMEGGAQTGRMAADHLLAELKTMA